MAEFTYRARVAQEVAISDTAVPITDAAFNWLDGELDSAKIATISAATADIRFLYTGDDPSATFGYVLPKDSILEIPRNENVNNLIFIRSSAVDAVLTITLEW